MIPVTNLSACRVLEVGVDPSEMRTGFSQEAQGGGWEGLSSTSPYTVCPKKNTVG
jgi:hypothetical protein